MCGIAGLWDPRGAQDEIRGQLTRMQDSLNHRGPDDRGHYVDETVGLGLAHTRLAIIDLSPNGRQPMGSHSGRFRIVFNGELYNYKDLRTELSALGITFSTDSDTEVLLAAIESWGLKNALQRFVGMFAFALWDAHRGEMTLVRDRVGIKPLFYGRVGSRFAFASEIKALKCVKGWSKAYSRSAFDAYFKHGFVPAPETIYDDVYELQPGHALVIDSKGQAASSSEEFWSLRGVIAESLSEVTVPIGECAFRDGLHQRLLDAVRLRMISDVPLGAFLSGGIDSSLIVALMQSVSKEPVRTFTIGFEESGVSEAKYAAAIAKHLGTDHNEEVLSYREALALVERLPQFFDQPFGDPSALPTALVSRVARQQVTVSLSGDGGDELFGGYSRYQRMMKGWQIGRWIPDFLSPAVTRLGLSGRLWKLLALANSRSPAHYYDRGFTQWSMESPLVSPSLRQAPLEIPPVELHPMRQMMFIDFDTYLPDDILAKVDRTSMDTSLEVRVPLLDHRVVEWVWRHTSNSRTYPNKGPLESLLSQYVPEALFKRPKMGFGIPLHEWLRGPLKQWGGDVLDWADRHGPPFLDYELIRRRWDVFQAGRDYETAGLWSVLVMCQWLEADAA